MSIQNPRQQQISAERHTSNLGCLLHLREYTVICDNNRQRLAIRR